MLLLFLSLFTLFNLLNCVEFEKASSNGLLKNKHEIGRNQNFMDSSIADSMWNSTPGIDQMNWITPHFSFPPPIDHETHLQSLAGLIHKGPSFTGKFPQTNRRNQKVTQRQISSIQLENNTLKYQPLNQLNQEIKVLEISRRRNPGFTHKASSYDFARRSEEPALHRIKRSHTLLTGRKKRLFPNLLLSDGTVTKDDATDSEDDDEFEKMVRQLDSGEGIMRMREIPEVTKTETTTATTVKHLRIKKADTHSYFEMIETLHEGYMMVFLIELTRLIATKERKAVHDVVQHAEQIIYGLHQSGQLLWFGKSLISFTSKVARSLKEWKIDVIQKHAANLHRILSQRHETLSVEVNTILEYADMLYDDDEGRLLFDALKEFTAYPNIRITGYWLCNSLIHNFLRPYRRLKDTQERRELIDSVNLVLKSYEKTQLRSSNVRQSEDSPDENPPPSQTEDSMIQSEPRSDTTRSPRKKKRKRQRIHRSRQKYSQRHHKERKMRSITEKAGVQTRFRVKN